MKNRVSNYKGLESKYNQDIESSPLYSLNDEEQKRDAEQNTQREVNQDEKGKDHGLSYETLDLNSNDPSSTDQNVSQQDLDQELQWFGVFKSDVDVIDDDQLSQREITSEVAGLSFKRKTSQRKKEFDDELYRWVFQDITIQPPKDPEIPLPQDVYPLSIYYSEAEKCWIRFYRLLAFLTLVWILVPFDLYIPNN